MEKFTEKILDYLQVQAENTVDLLDIMLSDRRSGMRKARRSLVHSPPEFKTRWADVYRERQSFYSLLNRLKRDGLVAKKKHGETSVWSITSDGQEYRTRLKERHGIPKRVYEKEKGEPVIVSFDVPERERRKRDWLRMNLLALGFTQLQKSIWIGNVAVPDDFIKDMRSQGMLSYVHIFSIAKAGSIVKKFEVLIH